MSHRIEASPAYSTEDSKVMGNISMMWHRIVMINDVDFGPIDAVWIAPEGAQLLLLTRERTLYWDVREDRALWSIREKAGGDGISPDGRIYRDLSSGLFYPVLGPHGGRQLHTHPIGGRIDVHDAVVVTAPDGTTHSLSHEGCSNDGSFGNWRIVTFCESGDHILIAGPRCLVVYAIPSRQST